MPQLRAVSISTSLSPTYTAFFSYTQLSECFHYCIWCGLLSDILTFPYPLHRCNRRKSDNTQLLSSCIEFVAYNSRDDSLFLSVRPTYPSLADKAQSYPNYEQIVLARNVSVSGFKLHCPIPLVWLFSISFFTPFFLESSHFHRYGFFRAFPPISTHNCNLPLNLSKYLITSRLNQRRKFHMCFIFCFLSIIVFQLRIVLFCCHRFLYLYVSSCISIDYTYRKGVLTRSS